jgi:hypothetical protein
VGKYYKEDLEITSGEVPSGKRLRMSPKTKYPEIRISGNLAKEEEMSRYGDF